MLKLLKKHMIDYSILNIPTVLNPPIILKDIIYNCPVCDYEIDIDMIVVCCTHFSDRNLNDLR